MSRADDMLAEQEAKAADLRKKADEAVRAAEREEAVLRGMKLMMQYGSQSGSRTGFGSLSVTPDVVGGIQTRVGVPRRGRQPGAISHEWRNTLGLLYWRNAGGFSIDHVVAAAHSNGLPNLGSRDAEDRMRAYIELGYVERHGDGFRVSELAAQKYEFSRRQTQEAPTADAEGAS